jgi:hypothetical protein
VFDGDAKPPPMALDPAGRGFAIVNGDTITLIAFDQLGLDAER